MSDPSPITRPGLVERFRRRRQPEQPRPPRVDDFVPRRKRIQATGLAILFGVATAVEPVLLARGINGIVALDPEQVLRFMGADICARGTAVFADATSSLLSTRMAAEHFYENALKRQFKRIRRSQPETGEGNVLGRQSKERLHHQTQLAISPTGELEAGKELTAEAYRLWWQYGTAFALSPLTMLALTPSPSIGLLLSMSLPIGSTLGIAHWRLRTQQELVLTDEQKGNFATVDELRKRLESKGGLTQEEEIELQAHHNEIAKNAGMGFVKRTALGITNTMWLGIGMVASAAASTGILVVPAFGHPELLLQNGGALAGALTSLAVFNNLVLRIFGVYDTKAAGEGRVGKSQMLRELLDEEALEREFMQGRDDDALSPEAELKVSSTFPAQFSASARIRQPVPARDIRIPLDPEFVAVFDHSDSYSLTKGFFNRIQYGSEAELLDKEPLPFERLEREEIFRMDSLMPPELQLREALQRRPRVALGIFDHPHLSFRERKMLTELSKRTTVLLGMANPADAWRAGLPSMTLGTYASDATDIADSVGTTEVLPNTRLAPVIGRTDTGAAAVRDGAVKLMALRFNDDPSSAASAMAAFLHQRYGIKDSDAILQIADRLEPLIEEALADGPLSARTTFDFMGKLPEAVNPVLLDTATRRKTQLLKPNGHVVGDLSTILPSALDGVAGNISALHLYNVRARAFVLRDDPTTPEMGL
jgi:hypothetical protein